jgi:hypothetical protein
LNSSCRNATTGWPIASDEVMPAKNSRPNHIAPAIGPKAPQLLNRVGRVVKAMPKPLPPAVAAWTTLRPRYAVAIGIKIELPRMTSTNSLTPPAVVALRAMSSRSRR